ncbi:MAG: FAD-binding oxidoreductase [Gemmataceae bacterium]|nr:FAD-binding oxidoreductase [Gemmataceae bacterium]
MSDDAVFIDGFGPLPMVRPTTVLELGHLVEQTARSGRAIYPIGGRTLLALGNTPSKAGQAVDLRALDKVIDYPARDMTITVQAGITIARLQEILAGENQRLPIDVPVAQEATLGGTLAANVSGARRLGYGTLRDYVIGLSAINDEGQEFKSGGRVVKNVAGYDICKLMVGSLGTLGVITQVTLKLRPLPEEQALVRFRCNAEKLGDCLDRLHQSRTRPVCLEVFNRAGAATLARSVSKGREDEWTIFAGYEGNAEAVQWQVQQLIKETGGDFSLEANLGHTASPLWQGLTDWDAAAAAETVFKASVLPSATADFLNLAARQSERVLLRAHAGNGVVWGHWPAGEIVVGTLRVPSQADGTRSVPTTLLSPAGLTSAEAAAMLNEWRERGVVVVHRCPHEWKTKLSVWGPSRADWTLMAEVKKSMDPHDVFNPGRLFSAN